MTLQCELCPKYCIIKPGQSGECRIRVNRNGKLTAVTYGYPCAVHRDPVEKKPVFHMLPGSWVFSLATVGCNLHCKNCQNWEISQANPEDTQASYLPPEKIPGIAYENECSSVAYTYTEPLVYYEYTLESSCQVRRAGLKNILVTAGYCNKSPLKKLFPYIDAANIDLKAFSDSFYRRICGATLKPVLETLVLARNMGVILEITNLLIPTLNDTDDEIKALCGWIAGNLGKEIPLHFSRFFPHYKLRNLPPTPVSTLLRAREIALDEGLYNVYIGNIMTENGENTFCHRCGKILIKRKGYTILKMNVKDGRCPWCGEEVYGIWK
jgi:pyruvate formate lyase activating enzyme